MSAGRGKRRKQSSERFSRSAHGRDGAERRCSSDGVRATVFERRCSSGGVRATVYERRKPGPRPQRQAGASRQRCGTPSGPRAVCMAETVLSDGARSAVFEQRCEQRHSSEGVRARPKIAKAGECERFTRSVHGSGGAERRCSSDDVRATEARPQTTKASERTAPALRYSERFRRSVHDRGDAERRCSGDGARATVFGRRCSS